MLVWNVDVDSSPYERIKNLARPGHADLTYELKYKHRDWRGGGRASARETVGRVAGGAIAKKLLSEFGIKIVAYTVMIGGIHAEIKRAAVSKIRRSPVRCPDLKASKRMEEVIKKAISRGDSVGGIIEVFCSGVPPGLGEPVFDKLDADLAKALMSIPAVKGVEIGDGFKITELWGSQANDRIVVRKGKIKSETNHAGGILGGISSGLPLIARVAVKPTSSIPLEQQTIDMKKWKTSKIKITGRHDPCIVPRAVPVVEAMVALVLADHGIRSGFIPMVL
jgi:chorismate synthase